MSTYRLELENNEFILDSDKCSFFMNDEEHPIEGVDEAKIIDLLNGSDLVFFSKEYYDQACENCHKNRREGSKYFDFSEFHFYLFSKDGTYVMSSLSEEYKDTTLPRLLKEGVVDASYIVSINVCENCGDYTIDMEFGLF